MTGGLYTAGTYGGLYSEGRFALERAGLENAALDARVLLQHATRRTWAELFDDEAEIAAPGEIAAFNDMIARRIAHVPVAQIAGVKEFWSLEFKVTPATLIPRPESEHLIERALELVPKESCGRILDLGTGTGCLLISFLKERPHMAGVGVDLSIEALEVAKSNAISHEVFQRCTFVQSDWTEKVVGQFELVLANPPYLTEAEFEAAAPEVREHEPRLALSPGTDGLDAYRAIARALPEVLAPGGHAVLELGIGQAAPVKALLESQGLDSVRISRDLAGLDRVITARKPIATKGLGAAKKRLESAP
jgi:release factor glutamine methyltransferase